MSLPPIDWNAHQREPAVDSPSECDPTGIVDLNEFLFVPRAPRGSKPRLVYDRDWPTDDAFHASLERHDR